MKVWCASSLDLGPFSCRLGTPKLSPYTSKLIQGVSNERLPVVVLIFLKKEEEERWVTSSSDADYSGEILFPRFMG